MHHLLLSLIFAVVCYLARRQRLSLASALELCCQPAAGPAEHPYYHEIDQAKRSFLNAHRDLPVATEREERLRARFRSHDPRRWRICPSCFGDETTTFEQKLYDWSDTQRALSKLEAERGMMVQHPPLAYSDEVARGGAEVAGKGWFFTIADFDHALLHGVLVLKSTSQESQASLVIDLANGVS